MQKSIDFDEPLYHYNQDENIWEEKSEILIILETKESFKKKFDKKLPLLTIKSNKPSLPHQIFSVSHSYEFHYYPKKNFLAEKEFKATNISRSPNIPHHVVVLSKKEKDENGELMFYFEIFGCNCMNTNSREKISLTLAKLYYEVRYSYISIIQQFQERLERIILKSFKEIIRHFANIEGYSFLTSTSDYLFHLLRKNNKYEDFPELLGEFENLVYKCIISEGLFPIYCEINTMNTNVIRLALSSILIPDSILPWSPKFHASFSVGDFHYSFNPNNRMNTKKMKDRNYRSNFFYVRIKILDFFPLDDWVKKIALFFFESISQIFSILREKNEEIFLEEEIQIPMESPKENNEGKNEFFLKTDDSQTFSKNIEINIDPLKEPLIKKTCFEKFFNKPNEKKNHNSKLFDEKMNEFKVNFKKESLLNLFYEFPLFEDIISSIPLEFYGNYKYELTNTQILWNICKIIARTELRQYETLSNNCQTPVAESLHIIHEKLKQFIEPLQEKKEFSIKSNKIQIEYFKFSSKLTRLMNEDKIIKPTVLDCNLDYFGIYADKYLQKYLENLKKVTVFENFQKVNDKISFSEKNIEVLFQNFGNKYRKVFDTMKDFSLSRFSENKRTLTSKGSSSKEIFSNDLIKNTMSDNSIFKKDFSIHSNDRLSYGQNNLFPRKQISLNNTSNIEENKNIFLRKEFSYPRKEDMNFKKDSSFLTESKKESPKKKLKKGEKINRAMSYFLFMCENIIYNNNIKISLSKDKEEKKLLILRKYELMNLYREFSYYYFNSIRLKNASKLNKNNISYVGFILIKDPAKLLFEEPENGKEIYSSAYM